MKSLYSSQLSVKGNYFTKTADYSESHLPQQIRISVGSAIILGLLKGKLGAAPTTAYLMTFRSGKCVANCSFCPQARSSVSKTELLSRVTWPVFSFQRVLTQIQSAVAEAKIRRVCIQALMYPGVFTDLVAIICAVKRNTTVPVSVSCQPMKRKNIVRLAEAGADRIGIPLDAATERVFDEVKGSIAGGPYEWGNQFKLLSEAVEIFGEMNVSTHLIIGLGETEEEAVRIIQRCVDMQVLPALFAFTPVHGTKMEDKRQPPVESYRRLQLARYLIVNHATRFENMSFYASGKIEDFSVDRETLEHVVDTGEPFLTSGCPACNRPFYNEKPGGPLYNHPGSITPCKIEAIRQQLNLVS